jgi:CPA1 family monovalent cation:H+ antiporter
MEAESLFNDGTVAVLFGLALAVVSGQALTGGELVWGFLRMVVGGVLCGALVGGLVLLLAGRTHDRLVEITFTTVAAYGSFMVAEHFGLSGVLATLTAGVVVGNLGPLGALSERGRGAVEDFWEYAAFVANSLVFLLLGAQLAGRGLAEGWLPIVIAIGVVLVGRAVSVYGCSVLWRWSAWKISARRQHLLFWGGLRGALALALALGLPEDMANRSLVVTTAFGVVAFSVLVQGLTIAGPLKKEAGASLPAPEAEG